MLTQLIICLFIVIFFSKMDASNTDILQQATNNSYSGNMVYILLIQLVIMVIDRFIYKSRSFTEVKNKTQKSKEQQVKLYNQIITID